MLWSILVVELMCLIGVAADYFFKVAGSGEEFILWKPFLLGTAIYAATGIGWFLVMKYLTLTQVGVLYSVSMVLLLSAMGVVIFKEDLGTREVIGIALAIASIFLTAKFA